MRADLASFVSRSGWSAIFHKEPTGGQFELDRSLLHINPLETKAVFSGL